ncbi:polysaccharide pyruvyl transferase family protein [Mucisphaera calidilacus]|uniref:Colanic acid biosynthesis protein n=1 Tax=Mucisphaera calidilacus TaxID=2527982 RepID=A0A518BVB5_9BACT|nr:polysaccharide pyruvyl transferase family protein [Mucisphaera calidilacus]QDU70919.1 colanic acid biosynthesis protein [Mucisphaera calidilacus]
MMIEIHGAGFTNKGAQLMIRTVINRVRESLPDADFCIETGSDARYPRVAEYGLHMLYPQATWDRPRRIPYLLRLSHLLGRVIPASFVRPFGLVRRQDVDALIDVSGYAFGDKFGVYKSRVFNQRAAAYAQRGKPVIVLPQMLGPFQEAGFEKVMAEMVSRSSLFYARDRMSLDDCRRLLGDRAEPIRLAPDITIYQSPGRRDVAMPDNPARTVAIVPNIRMLDKGDPRWKESYLPRLTAVGKSLRERGYDLHVVIHETRGGDARLGEQLRDAIDPSGVPVIAYEDPLDLKAYLGQCRLVIASRFHAVVGSLAMGTPAVVIGWAHKYEMLLEDFGIPQMIHGIDDGPDDLQGKVDQLLDDGRREAMHQTLVRRKAEMKPLNDEMWERVVAALRR